MKTYPSAPATLIASWNNQHSFTADPISIRFDGGLEQRTSAFEINLNKDTWSLLVHITTFAEYQELDKFIKDRDGLPFVFSYDGIVSSPEVYRINSHQWSWTGFKLWQLTVELERVHRPNL
ncbi:MAG: hypothetical protein F6K50_02775 [Moorea sp. SIO3I7]|uniref:hypothetical protein n=1 Tax=Moorena sp. SIO3I8 TaxID=2607833 RepID=UPI0013BF1FF6|nr:hypothetical protein [Moorena sp. SIO3I8]NEN94486.1 hypothetical protein [Moorena sp. SIO3I7]NEO04932.1 hypothetical protein [Moorena sp. SIO3I8]NEP51448.1 hypothetical protein [Moorena sp. SIO3C2]NES83317.1 hypothetical protein [Moorena sp. SIO2B7]